MRTVWMALTTGQLFEWDTTNYPPLLTGQFMLPTKEYERTKSLADTEMGNVYSVVRYQHELLLDGFIPLGPL